MKSMIKNKIARAVITGFAALAIIPSVNAIELLKKESDSGTTTVSMGGYAKVDIRHVNGDIAYQDYWVANFPGGGPIETSATEFNVKESRLNFKVTHGDVTGFIEMDFYGGNGNEIISNSTNPRVRHIFLQYKEWLVGQYWSTFMPLHALPEALDFGGPHVGEVFIRQTMVRYTKGNWQFAIENPETFGDGDSGASSSAVGTTGGNVDPDESVPDFIARYNTKGDWGQMSFGALIRKIDQGGIDETSMAANISGKIKTVGRDDFRFQVSLGEPGRYVAAAMTPDIWPNENGDLEVEQTTAYTVAYRHFWGDSDYRSTIFYGAAEADESGRERNHFGVNLLTNVTPKLTTGVELGRYSIEDAGIESINSTYLQFSTKFAF